jgi:eukaryotic-like serine/threonine-protein kinase
MALDVGPLVAQRYQLEERLDAGGRAQVWRAVDQELGRLVAVKILLTPEGGDPSFLEAFRAQAQLEARMKHPGIVEVFDWGHDGDTNYVVMELLEGSSVRRLLDNGPLPPDRVVDLGTQAAAALAYAHAEGVAHGSITSAHVVVAPDGGAKLIDFGLQCHGVCEYPALPDSDTFSLGELLYEALVGASPSGPRPASLAEGETWPAHPRKMNPKVSAPLDRVVMKAIASDPNDRYATAAELQAALDAVATPMSNAGMWTLLAIMAIAIAGVSIYYFTSPKTVAVPDVTNLSTAQAQSTLSAAGLGLVVNGQASSKTVASGNIVSETPSAGASVRQGSQVSVIVSSGHPQATVPSLIGLTLEAASSSLASAGLTPGNITTQNNATFAADTIIGQTPGVGADVPAGTKVDLVKSSGPPQVTVPSVSGMTRGDATARLTNAGLVAEVGTAYSNQPSGIVISQGPAAGTTVASGGTVTLSVSRGPVPIKIPNVTGAQASTAAMSLQNVGLVPVSVPTSGTASQVGTVISQSPAAGSKIAPGSQVRIFVGQ